MNMIPLVRATEPEKAQNANRHFTVLNCSLEILYQIDLLSNSFWKKGSQRVRIPSVTCVRLALHRLAGESGCLRLQP